MGEGFHGADSYIAESIDASNESEAFENNNLKTYDEWLKEGRQVKKGEKGHRGSFIHGVYFRYDQTKPASG